MRLAYLAFDVPHARQASHTHISEIVRNLTALGWSVELFAPDANKPASSSMTKFIAYARIIAALAFRLRTFDVLYVRSHPASWPVSALAGIQRIPIVQEVNGTELDVIVTRPWLRFIRPVVTWLYRSQFQMAAHLFTVTDELASWVRKSIPTANISTVPNAANVDLFVPASAISEPPFVVFVGSLTAWHGVELMINAVRSDMWPEGVRLRIVGSGAMTEAVQQAAGSGAPIDWLGARPYREIPALMSGALAGLVPITNPKGRSSTGVLPLKLFEMMSCGLATIVTDLPGQADLVRNGDCGLVIEPTPDALAHAVSSLAANLQQARVLGERAAALVRASHTWANRAQTIDAVLRRLC